VGPRAKLNGFEKRKKSLAPSKNGDQGRVTMQVVGRQVLPCEPRVILIDLWWTK